MRSVGVVSHRAFLLILFPERLLVKMLFGIAHTPFKPIGNEMNKGIGVVLVNSPSFIQFPDIRRSEDEENGLKELGD